MQISGRYSTVPSLAEMMTMHRLAAGRGRWEATPESGLETASLSVFGARGNRYSVVVVKKGAVTDRLAGRKGGWTLTDRWETGSRIRFRLLWAADTGDDCCLALCGREVLEEFSTSA
ncbi:MAG: hypothetical protein AVO35_03775 [Candidatus Aegiribacteria sp. MLS_C]|nr:MAG: hypothetical protein AVO35_03775 [Candidatus Aegiribacteria sp. MLS_C]